MKKNLLLCLLFCSGLIRSQCPTVSCPAVLTLTNCQTGQTVAATSSYSANITSRWIGPGNIPISSVETSTSVVNLNFNATYTVEFKDNSSNCVVSKTLSVAGVGGRPNFSLTANSFTMLCTSSVIFPNVPGAVTTPVPGGPVSYTMIGPITATSVAPSPGSTLSILSTYSIGTCGDYAIYTMDNTSNCIGSFSFVITCSTLSPTPINIIGTNTTCLGSSVSFTANGSGHNWSTGANTATMNVIPTTNTVYAVSALDGNNCPSSGSVAVTVNNSCSQVWPGDANSDGLVDNTDVLELGLAFSSTGANRTPGGNLYTSQYSTNWTGTVSSGKNLCHADCNGDGVINNNDTIAILTNYLLPHAFKTSEISSNPELNIIAQPIVNAGIWNKADIVLGDGIININQLYGLAFDVNFDQSMIEADSVYLVYPASFLNNNSQNIQFRKTLFNAGKVFAASVRTDGNNVTGSAKIAELHFKLKFGLPENTFFNLSVSNAKKIDHTGISQTLSGGGTSALLDGNTTVVKENNFSTFSVLVFPNPAKDQLNLLSNSDESIYYLFSDISGRKVFEGEFVRNQFIDLTEVDSGTYLVRFESRSAVFHKKVLIER